MSEPKWAPYRKRPVVVQAYQWRREMRNVYPVHYMGMDIATNTETFAIETFEGTFYIADGDWVIQGVQGELYPCKPDIFKATYEAVDDE